VHSKYATQAMLIRVAGLLTVAALAGCMTKPLQSPSRAVETAAQKRPSAEPTEVVSGPVVPPAQHDSPSPSGTLAEVEQSLPEGPLRQRLALARLLEKRNQFDQAKATYEHVLQKHPKLPLAHHRLGVIAARDADYERAHRHFQVALKAGEPNAKLLNDVGYAYYLENRIEDAEAMFRKAIRQDAGYAAAHTNLGLVLGIQGRVEEGMEAFQRAGSEADAYANLGYVYTQTGRYKRAQWAYHQALSKDDSLRPQAEALLQLVGRQQPLPEEPEGFIAPNREPSEDEDDRPVEVVATDDPAPASTVPAQGVSPAQRVENSASHPWVAKSPRTARRTKASKPATSHQGSLFAPPSTATRPRTMRTSTAGGRPTASVPPPSPGLSHTNHPRSSAAAAATGFRSKEKPAALMPSRIPSFLPQPVQPTSIVPAGHVESNPQRESGVAPAAYYQAHTHQPAASSPGHTATSQHSSPQPTVPKYSVPALEASEEAPHSHGN